jgi:hypothetical protein
MENRIIKKILVLGIIILFVGTAAPQKINGDIIENNNVKKDSENRYINSIIDKSMLDLRYIYNITKALSEIIFTEYNESAGELAKGRNFGTKGERKAAEILFENMTKLGLYTWREPINNTPRTLCSMIPKIACNIDTLERGLTIKKISDWSITPVTEYCIAPRWNFTGTPPIIAKVISLILHPNGFIEQKYNFYNKERLTNNFSYTNLKVKRKPYIYSFVTKVIRNYKNKEPFVYIAKDTDYCKWQEPISKPKYIGIIKNIIFQNIPYNEQVLWTAFQSNCKGLILYDSDNDTYNSPGSRLYNPLPIIHINGSLGRKIFDNPDDYRIDFYINQQWNESVESYNVIGQKNGTNPNETVIVSCLYDSQWNQGTGDSAIGMAIVLGLAKYMKDQNITPRCNVRFIGFCGEELYMRGAYYYEAYHRNESKNLSLVIDLNQLGFKWTNPKLSLVIIPNSEELLSTVNEIANRTDYVNRTGNVTNFGSWVTTEGTPISNAMVFAKAKKKKIWYNTILFVKKGQWYNHHKDGMNHQEGDVIEYFDFLDTSVTSEMIWNVTEHLTVKDNIPLPRIP